MPQLLYSVFLPSLAIAQTAEEPSESNEAFDVRTFEPPKRVEVKTPRYPRAYLVQGREGWVTMSMMIDPEGKPYDVTVTNSSDDLRFEEAAVKAAELMRYEPALLDGVPIDSGTSFRITFELQGGEVGAGTKFVSRYRRLIKAISDNEHEVAKERVELLEKMDRNLYEEAYFQMGLFRFARQWGDETQQYDALVRAAFFDKGRSFLSEAASLQVLQLKLNLELKHGNLAAALATAKSLLEREVSLETKGQIERVQTEVAEILDGDQQLVAKGWIRRDNYYNHSLSRNSFALTSVEGDVAEIRLHCDKGYVGFNHQEGVEYTVHEDWDACRLIVIGDPGTTFNVAEG